MVFKYLSIPTFLLLLLSGCSDKAETLTTANESSDFGKGCSNTIKYPIQKPKAMAVLDESDGKNAIVIRTDAGEMVVDEPFQAAVIKDKDTLPEAKQMSKEEVMGIFAETKKALPKKPASVLFHYDSGKTDIKAEDLPKLDEIATLVEERIPCDVIIIGHSDRVGSDSANSKISLERADKIKKLIEEKNLDILSLTTEYYGENDPIVPTEDDVAEPLNRRVEVMVR